MSVNILSSSWEFDTVVATEAMGGVFKISDENCNETEEFNNTDILFVNFLFLMTVLFVIVWGICCYSLLTVWKRRAFRFKESKSNGQ